jgi:hypothetical protein
MESWIDAMTGINDASDSPSALWNSHEPTCQLITADDLKLCSLLYRRDSGRSKFRAFGFYQQISQLRDNSVLC